MLLGFLRVVTRCEETGYSAACKLHSATALTEWKFPPLQKLRTSFCSHAFMASSSSMAASVVPLLVTRILPFLLLSGLEVLFPRECPAEGTVSVATVLEPHTRAELQPGIR